MQSKDLHISAIGLTIKVWLYVIINTEHKMETYLSYFLYVIILYVGMPTCKREKRITF